jgi:hypothetical protein
VRGSILLVTTFVLSLSCPQEGRCEPQVGAKVISENDVRAASERLYSDILSRACRHGWRYSRTSIEHGFERHFGEMKAELIASGYIILPRSSPTSPAAVTRHPAGCSGPYWLRD